MVAARGPVTIRAAAACYNPLMAKQATALTQNTPATQITEQTPTADSLRCKSAEDWCVAAAANGQVAPPLASLIRMLRVGAPVLAALRSVGIHEVMFAGWLERGVREWQAGKKTPFAKLAIVCMEDRSKRVERLLTRLQELTRSEEVRTALDSVKLALAFHDEEMDKGRSTRAGDAAGGGVTVVVRTFGKSDGTAGSEVEVTSGE